MCGMPLRKAVHAHNDSAPPRRSHEYPYPFPASSKYAYKHIPQPDRKRFQLPPCRQYFHNRNSRHSIRIMIGSISSEVDRYTAISVPTVITRLKKDWMPQPRSHTVNYTQKPSPYRSKLPCCADSVARR